MILFTKIDQSISKEILSFVLLKILTCWCCRLFKCELNCFWLVKSILQTVHEKHRIDLVIVWLLVDVWITCVGSGIERNELEGSVDVEGDTSTESVRLESVFYD
jgi:hypothetical protein